MSCKAHRVVNRSELSGVVPSRFAEALNSLDLAFPLDVLVFSQSVLTSGSLKRALPSKTVPGENNLLILGTDLTVEARMAATEARAEFVMTKNLFGWSDANYEGIRTQIGARAKKPDVRARENEREGSSKPRP